MNDESYNQNRHASTGNRFKEALNGLMQKGVQLELCGATAKGNAWISYNSSEYLRERHGLPQDLVQNIAVVEVLAAKAAE